MSARALCLHASCVAVPVPATGWRAILILGAAGSGKSSLALQLLALGARLVSDDRTQLTRAGTGTLWASAPPALRGRIEWRGVGLLPAHALDGAVAVAAVDLDSPAPARLPAPTRATLLDVALPCLHKPDSSAVAAGLWHYMLSQAWADPEGLTR